jgi:hypothetical protein
MNNVEFLRKKITWCQKDEKFGRCQVEDSTTGRSANRRNHVECGVFECYLETSTKRWL